MKSFIKFMYYFFIGLKKIIDYIKQTNNFMEHNNFQNANIKDFLILSNNNFEKEYK